MPTRRQNILDQFLSNMGKLYCEAQLLPPLGRSDHQCILFSALNQQRHGKAISRSVRTFKPDNLRSLGLKLNLESWSAVYEASDVNEKVEAFNSIIINSLDTCKWFKYIYSLCGAQQLLKTPAAPNKAELQKSQCLSLLNSVRL